MHTLMDLCGSIPSFIHVRDRKMHNVNVLDLLLPEAGSIYLVDRTYLDLPLVPASFDQERILSLLKRITPDGHLRVGGGVVFHNAQGNPWTADYFKITGELDVDLRSNIAAEAWSKIIHVRLFDF